MQLFILLCLLVGAFASKECPSNSHYNACGTACPLTCENYKNPPKACVLMCNPGCHCDEGYVKNKDGQCVLPEDCEAPVEAVCEDNEEFKECGTACPLTCDNYDNPPKACVKMCVKGCHCKEGYVKSNNGRCVLPEQCPSREPEVCGENQEYQSCGTACPLTCDNYDNPPKICVLMCVPGCHCAAGYVKSKDGRCVLPENCPSRQPAYQALDRPDCDKGPETGFCRARVPRFYYDQEAGMCKQFIYGGCGGNRNNFKTEFDCYNKCGALAAGLSESCLQEMVVGPCRAAFKRYFYNKASGQCEEFTYGGCKGNDNNFESMEDCHAVCSV